MFDRRDCVNIGFGYLGETVCLKCFTVIGTSWPPLVELKRVHSVNNVVVYTGRREVCNNVLCPNPNCVRYVTRHGSAVYSQMHPNCPVGYNANIFNGHRTVLHRGGYDDPESHCVPVRNRAMFRLRYFLERVPMPSNEMSEHQRMLMRVLGSQPHSSSFRHLMRSPNDYRTMAQVHVAPSSGHEEEVNQAFAEMQGLLSNAVRSLDARKFNFF